jgi:hypothetical protein
MSTTITVSPAGEVRITVDGAAGPPVLDTPTNPERATAELEADGRVCSIRRDQLTRWFSCDDPAAFVAEVMKDHEGANSAGFYKGDLLVISPAAIAKGGDHGPLGLIEGEDGHRQFSRVWTRPDGGVEWGGGMVGPSKWLGVAVGILRPMPMPTLRTREALLATLPPPPLNQNPVAPAEPSPEALRYRWAMEDQDAATRPTREEAANLKATLLVLRCDALSGLTYETVARQIERTGGPGDKRRLVRAFKKFGWWLMTEKIADHGGVSIFHYLDTWVPAEPVTAPTNAEPAAPATATTPPPDAELRRLLATWRDDTKDRNRPTASEFAAVGSLVRDLAWKGIDDLLPVPAASYIEATAERRADFEQYNSGLNKLAAWLDLHGHGMPGMTCMTFRNLNAFRGD